MKLASIKRGLLASPILIFVRKEVSALTWFNPTQPYPSVRRGVSQSWCARQDLLRTISSSLSDIDVQNELQYQQPLIMFYPAMPGMKEKDPAKVIKNALAEALVYYYPLAGRLRNRPSQMLEVDCTAEGVVYGEADADICLEELGEQPLVPPYPYLEKLLCRKTGYNMEVVGCPMLTMQVTRFSCGGFILALSFNHVMCDGTGIIQFLTAITEFARGASDPSVLPVWRRSLLLNSPDPRHVTPNNNDDDDDDNNNNNNNAPIAPPNDLVRRTFSFNASDIATLTARLPPHLRPSTDFELIAAALWHCRTVALQCEPNEEVHLGFAVNIRRKFSPQLPTGYYGNASVLATAVSPAGKICEDGTLGYAVELVKKAKHTLAEEHKRSLIEPGISRGHQLPVEARTYIISDLSRIGLSSLDFGWGKPVYSGPADNSHLPHIVGFMTAFKNEKGQEVKVVPVYLQEEAMDRLAMVLENLLNEQ